MEHERASDAGEGGHTITPGSSQQNLHTSPHPARLSTPDLVVAQQEFFNNHLVQFPNHRSVFEEDTDDDSYNSSGRRRHRFSIRRRRTFPWDTTRLNNMLGEKKALVCAIIFAILTAMSLIAAFASLITLAATDSSVHSGLIAWGVLNTCATLMAIAFAYSVYKRNRLRRDAAREEVMGLRERFRRSEQCRRDLEERLEFAELTINHRRRRGAARPPTPHALMLFPVTPKPEQVLVENDPADDTLGRAITADFAIQNNEPVRSNNDTVTPSTSEGSILTQLCEGITRDLEQHAAAQAQASATVTLIPIKE